MYEANVYEKCEAKLKHLMCEHFLKSSLGISTCERNKKKQDLAVKLQRNLSEGLSQPQREFKSEGSPLKLSRERLRLYISPIDQSLGAGYLGRSYDLGYNFP